MIFFFYLTIDHIDLKKYNIEENKKAELNNF